MSSVGAQVYHQGLEPGEQPDNCPHCESTLIVKKMVGVIPHQCEGGAGCAFPDLEHVRAK